MRPIITSSEVCVFDFKRNRSAAIAPTKPPMYEQTADFFGLIFLPSFCLIIIFVQMSFFRKLFSSAPAKQSKTDGLVIYLDADLKKSIEAKDQLVRDYEAENNFDEDQFLYQLVLSRRTGEVLLKRRLNGFERLGDCVRGGEDQKVFVVVGQGAERSTIPRIASQVPAADNLKFMRSGTLSRYNDTKGSFQECQLKLHHDYLTFYKFKESERKVSFVPLENSVVEVVNEKKNMFSVKDKFSSTVFRTSSKEDMFGWLYAITEAIKIRNSQIYMNDMEDKLAKSVKNNLNNYLAKCANLKDHSRILPLDDIGRKALRTYFSSHPVPTIDAALLSLIEAYLFMCRCRRERGQAHSEQVLDQLRRSMQEMQGQFPPEVAIRDLSSKNQFVKTIQEMMKYLDIKYRKEIIEKKNVHNVFQNYLLEQYREDRKIPLKTLFGADPN